MPAKKSEDQITREIGLLKELRGSVRQYNFFGESNWLQIDAQIDVLEKRMTSDEVHDAYEGLDETGYLLSAALSAMDWMDGSLSDDERPSEGWRAVVEPS